MQLLRIPEVAGIIRTSEGRVYELVRDNVLPAVRLGRQLRVDEDVLREWIRAGGRPLAGGWRRQPQADRQGA